MKIRFHGHARSRMRERGATIGQVKQAVTQGHSAPAKFGRTRFRHVFPFNAAWNAKHYARKQIDAFAARIRGGWLIVTVIVRYF